MQSNPQESKPWSQQSAANRASPAANSEQSQHESLREYETRRRLAYANKNDSMALYWKSYRDLMSSSLEETGRAQRLVLGTSRAHQLYADAMKAMHTDVFLDEKGNITNEKQQKKLAFSRRPTSRPNSKSGTVLKEVRDSHKVIAERFDENSKNMAEEIADAIGSLLDHLKQQFTSMETLGNSILSELEKTEEEVTKAWGAYLPVASAKFSPNSTLSPQESAPKAGSDTDLWVVEMQYRVVVGYQNTAWEKGTAELTRLFDKVKQEECLRRMNLREFLVAFAQRQQRLFLSLPSVHNSVLESLVGKEISREEMEAEIQVAIDEKTAKLKKSSISTETKSATEEKYGFLLESPLSSDLTCKAKVVQRKGSGMSSTWTTCLAVMTADSYLHLFNVEGVERDAPIEDAFKSLIPKIVIPSPDNLLLGKSNFTKGWSDCLTPADSMVLSNCKMSSKGLNAFELTETVANTGASRMLGKSMTKRVLIRTITKGEADDWIAVLTA